MTARRIVVKMGGGFVVIICLAAILYGTSAYWPSSAPVYSKADASSSTSSSAPKIIAQWQIPSRGLDDLTFSNDGKFIAFIDSKGAARCYNADGMLLWSRDLASLGVKHLQVGPEGTFTIAYTLLNPSHSQVCFLDNSGNIRWAHTVEGAPWSVSVSPDKSEFAVGTGERYVYIYTLGKRSKRYIRWRPMGVPTSLSFTTPDQLLVGSWQDAGVGLYVLRGRKEWIQEGEQDKLYFVQSDDSAQSIVSLAVPNRNVSRSVLTLMDRTGSTLWRQELEGFEPKALISRSGRHVAVGYRNNIQHKGKQVTERHVALYSDEGRLLWDKGGMFFKPRLAGIISNDAVTAYDEKFLYVIDRSGKVVAKEKLVSPLKGAWADRSGRRIAVLGTNGRLYCYVIK